MEKVIVKENIKYIGVDDKDLDLFESQYIIPNGISYNSYLIKDEKNVVMDTVDKRKTSQWIKNLEEANLTDNDERREEITKEIEKLQSEAEHAKGKESESKISEINSKLEALIEEVKKLNS